MKKYAVIPTKGERNDWLYALCAELWYDNVQPIIVNNGEGQIDDNFGRYMVINFDFAGDPVNLSLLWNLGITTASNYQRHVYGDDEEFVVAVLNDDLALPRGFVGTLAEAILRRDAAGAFPSNALGREYVLTESQPVPLAMRMAGFAFVLRGSKNLRADESLLWWFGDDDLDWRIRQAGGNVGVPIAGIQHFDPNGYTSRDPKLSEQAGRDRETFAAKWGITPW